MTIWVEDTARNNLVAWCQDARHSGSVEAAVLSPFCTPTTKNWKQGVGETTERLTAAGIKVWLDPQSHAFQTPNVGNFRHYDTWDLWDGPKGDHSSSQLQRGHILKVFEAQDSIDAPHLAPTILLASAQSPDSETALEMAKLAVAEDPRCFLTIAGDAQFWSAGTELDAHVGALVQCQPAGWFLVVVRQFSTLPVPASSREIQGLCRAARALGEHAHVHLSHGDLAALPAFAAGATSLGTGWDARQKVCSYADFQANDLDQDAGGGWFKQVTYEKLLSYILSGDSKTLENQNRRLHEELLPGTLEPVTKSVWLHHAAALRRITQELDIPDPAERYEKLIDRYGLADTRWRDVANELSKASQHNTWIHPFRQGLLDYGALEGF